MTEKTFQNLWPDLPLAYSSTPGHSCPCRLPRQSNTFGVTKPGQYLLLDCSTAQMFCCSIPLLAESSYPSYMSYQQQLTNPPRTRAQARLLKRAREKIRTNPYIQNAHNIHNRHSIKELQKIPNFLKCTEMHRNFKSIRTKNTPKTAISGNPLQIDNLQLKPKRQQPNPSKSDTKRRGNPCGYPTKRRGGSRSAQKQ